MHFFWVNPLSTLTYPLVISSMSIPHWSSMISRVIHLYLIDLICSLSVFSHIMFLYFPMIFPSFRSDNFPVETSPVRPCLNFRTRKRRTTPRRNESMLWRFELSEDPSSQGKLTTSNSTPAVFFFKKASKNRLWSSLMSDLFVDLGAILWKRGWAAIKCTPAACRAYPS